MNDFLVASPSELPRAAADILALGYRHIAFYGELGAGKTALVKALCGQLGVYDHPSSPSYALVHIYQAAEAKIYHLDLYRLNRAAEVADLGLPDMLDDEAAYCFIEWPEIAEDFLPDSVLKLRITAEEDESRRIDRL